MNEKIKELLYSNDRESIFLGLVFLKDQPGSKMSDITSLKRHYFVETGGLELREAFASYVKVYGFSIYEYLHHYRIQENWSRRNVCGGLIWGQYLIFLE